MLPVAILGAKIERDGEFMGTDYQERWSVVTHAGMV
jgi:hypothetical protein